MTLMVGSFEIRAIIGCVLVLNFMGIECRLFCITVTVSKRSPCAWLPDERVVQRSQLTVDHSHFSQLLKDLVERARLEREVCVY